MNDYLTQPRRRSLDGSNTNPTKYPSRVNKEPEQHNIEKAYFAPIT
ncbi:hypothetical protein SynBIOSE41_01942 [Synechococcus sp. BIOS-E4-1]|nr:hypothetical protein SynBIOSE41_01942 [Synechococcus sp. BIOS-E4-1]